jgi:acetyltransferase-like isoleucine patch superfamily enzyme
MTEAVVNSNIYKGTYDDLSVDYQPWLKKSAEMLQEQENIKSILAEKANATIGKGCFVSKGAAIFTNSLEIGDGTWVAHGAILRGVLKIGRNSSINPYAHIAGQVTIGSDVRIAGMVSIYGMNHGFSQLDVPISSQPHTAKGITIGDGVWVGANAVIVDGCSIGANCIIGAGAVVTKSFPPFQIIAGNPARIIRDRRQENAAAGATRPNEPATRLPIRSILYQEDPYQNLRTSYEPDFQGWGSTHPILRRSIEELKPGLIVEIGTWKGASAIHMAELCRELGVAAEIVCVDTWLGNWQHWSRTSGVGSRSDLKLQNGFPNLYYQFLSNVVAKGANDIITPLPLTSIAAAKLFAHVAQHPDLVYLDADHEYESVIGDLLSWLPLLSQRGFLIGDDYDWPGVKRAVDEIVTKGDWSVRNWDNKFQLTRIPGRGGPASGEPTVESVS